MSTIKVHIKNGWMAPNGYFYSKGEQDIPASLKDKLPSSVKLHDPDAPVEPEKFIAPKKRITTLVGDLNKQKPPVTLAEVDVARTAAEAVGTANAEAEGNAAEDAGNEGEDDDARMERLKALRAASRDTAPAGKKQAGPRTRRK